MFIETFERRRLMSADGAEVVGAPVDDKPRTEVVFFDSGEHTGQGGLRSHTADGHAVEGLETAAPALEGARRASSRNSGARARRARISSSSSPRARACRAVGGP